MLEVALRKEAAHVKRRKIRYTQIRACRTLPQVRKDKALWRLYRWGLIFEPARV